MYHLFLVNPAAGKADETQRIEAEAQALCRRLGEPYEVQVSQAPGDLTRLAQAAGATGRETRIYACGGDGTLNEVVRGAFPWPNLAVTSYPCGSGNDYIKQFPNADAFFRLENFARVEERRMDLMDLGEDIAVNVCSVGFDARIGTDIGAYRRLPLLSGPRAYHASVVVNLIRGVVRPCRVEIPGEAPIDQDLTMVCVCNGSWYGGSYHPVPEARGDDGILDVLVVRRVSRLTVARVISAYQKGQFRAYPEIITHYRTNGLRIITPTPQPVNLDGELRHSRETNITLRPGALRFFLPKA